jgi:hypothetical protein
MFSAYIDASAPARLAAAMRAFQRPQVKRLGVAAL